MTNSSSYTAVVDRIVDSDTAVFLLEAADTPVDQLDMSLDEAPAETAEGEVFTVEITADGDIVGFEHRPEESADRLQRNRDRLDRLGSKLDTKREEE